MNMIEAVKSVYSNYVTFSGRARRAEFWWFVLFYIIVGMVLSFIDAAIFGTTVESGSLATGDYSYSSQTNTPILSGIFYLATLLPYLAVSVRRLHDINRVGWWLLIGFIPIIGIIVLIVFFATGGDKGRNRFGSDPIDGSGGDGGGEDYGATSIPPVSNQ